MVLRHLLNREVADVVLGHVDTHGTVCRTSSALGQALAVTGQVRRASAPNEPSRHRCCELDDAQLPRPDEPKHGAETDTRDSRSGELKPAGTADITRPVRLSAH
jgi:hypothetical protein